jgi:hypothetical protein
MSVKAKITLSDKELSLVLDPEIILTKRAIIDKVYDLFADMAGYIQTSIIDNGKLPEELHFTVPKISKGENYLQLPYVMLDYPRFFGKEDVFAIRTMFWWGNFFSITIMASGIFRKLINTDAVRGDADFFVNVNEDPWQHHFAPDNFIKCNKLSSDEWSACISNHAFIKFALKYNLEQWNEMPELLREGYRQIAGLLINYQGGEIIPSPGIPRAGSDL